MRELLGNFTNFATMDDINQVLGNGDEVLPMGASAGSPPPPYYPPQRTCYAPPGTQPQHNTYAGQMHHSVYASQNGGQHPLGGAAYPHWGNNNVPYQHQVQQQLRHPYPYYDAYPPTQHPSMYGQQIHQQQHLVQNLPPHMFSQRWYSNDYRYRSNYTFGYLC